MRANYKRPVPSGIDPGQRGKASQFHRQLTPAANPGTIRRARHRMAGLVGGNLHATEIVHFAGKCCCGEGIESKVDFPIQTLPSMGFTPP